MNRTCHHSVSDSLRWAVLVWVCLLQAMPSANGQIPVVGIPVLELEVLDDTMLQMMTSNSISAASLSMMRNGVVVFHHVYGWQDRQGQRVLRPDSVFRMASVTKPFTAAAIRKLIIDGHFTLSTKVFSLGVPGAGILDHVPFGTPDSRLGSITVDHLLQHVGGWDRNLVGDLTYREKTIASAMGVPSPPGRDSTVRYIMGQPLQYNPGATYAYSNIGFLLLGLIIEKVSGVDYRTYLQENVIGPAGFGLDDWLLGRTFAADQDVREPFYDEPTLATNVFHPAYSNVSLVERPYGSFDLEARTGQGRLVTSGFVVLGYLNTYQVAGSGIGGPRPAPGGWKWNHTGSLSGSNSLARQRGDGINYAVMFNKRPSSGTDYASVARTNIDAIIDGGTITQWPLDDISQIPPEMPAISLDSETLSELRFSTESGRHYQWECSENLVTWEEEGIPFVGTGSEMTMTASPSISSTKFYRLVAR